MSTSADSKLGETIKKLRKQKGWSQAELAKATDSTLSHINKIETGKYNPSLDALVQLSEAFEITIDQLIHGDDAEFARINLKNKNSAQLAKIIDSLEGEERKTIVGMLQIILQNKNFKNAVTNKDLLKEIAS